MSKIQILTGADIQQKIKRLALEIIEKNNLEQQVILAAVAPTGNLICQQLQKYITEQSSLVCILTEINIDKQNPTNASIDKSIDYRNKVVIIVDDVSMTGRVISYAMQPFLAYYPSKIQTLVLIERQQKNFPIHSDYVGLHISTTLQEHILVHQQNGEFEGASLN